MGHQSGRLCGVSQTIDIYVLKWGISQGDYAIGTAAGIFKSFVSIVLIVIANQIAKRNGEEVLGGAENERSKTEKIESPEICAR